jgi:excisionase family DNA binding protein
VGYLTVKDVAELLNCSEKTIYSWAEVRHEGFPAYKLGNGRKSLLRFKLDEIEQWVQKCKVRDE